MTESGNEFQTDGQLLDAKSTIYSNITSNISKTFLTDISSLKYSIKYTDRVINEDVCKRLKPLDTILSKARRQQLG